MRRWRRRSRGENASGGIVTGGIVTRGIVTVAVGVLLGGLLAPFSAMSSAPAAVAAASTAAAPGVSRLASEDRYRTAALISATTFARDAPVVYVASGVDFADALSGSAAAGRVGAPILLTQPNGIPAVVLAELERLRPRAIHVLGGPAAVSASVMAQLAGYTTGSVTRIEGETRYATSAAISAHTYPAGAKTAYLASGELFPDALSVAAYAAGAGAPVLLTRADGLPADVERELRRLAPDRIVVLGGTGAVSAATAQQAGRATNARVDRTEGLDRYSTSAAVTRAATGSTAPVVYVTSGVNFPDALAGAAAAAKTGAPLLLVSDVRVPGPIAAELIRLRPERIIVLGGPVAVSDAVVGVLADIGTARVPATAGRITTGSEVRAGSCLASPSGIHRLCVGTDGVVRVQQGEAVLWSSAGTSSPRTLALRLRADGDLVLLSTTGEVIWRSSTAGAGVTEVRVENGGDVTARTASTPTAAIRWSTLTNPASPTWGLPFEAGLQWSAGAPHSSLGRNDGARGSLDFGPRAGSSKRVVTIAPGTVYAFTCGGGQSYLGVQHADGWQSTYYHLVNEQRALIGQYVPAGTYLGDAAQTLPCGGGSSFEHVHLTIRRAGQPVSVEGMTFGGYTVRGSGRDFWGQWFDASGTRRAHPQGGAACCLIAPEETK